jgi:hypothetical protein
MRPIEDGKDNALAVYTRPLWEQKCQQGEYLQFTKAVLEDWGQIDPSESMAVFQDLQDASLGPLLSMKSGECSEDDLKELLLKELEITI